MEKSANDWKELANKELARFEKTTDDLKTNTPEGIEVKPLYTSEDIKDINESLPGFNPYTRGPRTTMYTARPWTIRQYAGFSTAKESNAFYKRNLAAGQKGLSVAFDLPTQRGYDSDNERVSSDVGKTGVAIDTVEDMKVLFDGIPLDKMSVSMTMNGAVIPTLAFYIVAAKEQGVSEELLTGTIQNDVLKEYMTRNTYIYPPKPSMRIIADIMAYCSKNMPKFNTISISGYHIGEAGANCAQQIAFTIADGIEYVKSAINAGLEVDAFAPRLSFFFGIGMDLFMNVAMLRAARTLWAKEMKQFNPQKPQSSMLRTHSQTSGWTLTEQDPYNNIIRTTVEALAATLGGTQSLHTNAYDEALGLPTDFSARIARNTQIILQEESEICNTVDPLAGSYYVESLTEELQKKAKEIMGEIDKAGGMASAIEQGIPKRMIEENAAKVQSAIDQGKKVIVGVNKYKIEEKDETPVLKIDDSVRKMQIDSIETVKKNRDEEKVKKALDEIRNAAHKGGNLLEKAVVAAELRATLGEITSAMEDIFTRYALPTDIISGVVKKSYEESKDAEKLKNLIKKVDDFAEKNGRRPRLLVAKIGQDGHDRGAKVVASAASDVGFDVDLTPMFSTPSEAAKIAVDNDVNIIGVSSLGGGHLSIIPELKNELKKLERDDIKITIGGVIPPQDYDELKKSGALEIFGPGTPMLDSLDKTIDLLK